MGRFTILDAGFSILIILENGDGWLGLEPHVRKVAKSKTGRERRSRGGPN